MAGQKLTLTPVSAADLPLSYARLSFTQRASLVSDTFSKDFIPNPLDLKPAITEAKAANGNKCISTDGHVLVKV